jgi:hypothetical protein
MDCVTLLLAFAMLYPVSFLSNNRGYYSLQVSRLFMSRLYLNLPASCYWVVIDDQMHHVSYCFDTK